MKIWINKCNDEKPNNNYENSYIFNIKTGGSSNNITSNLEEKLSKFKQQSIDSIYDDLYVIALSIFAIDKRFSRKQTNDCWTRQFDVSIPVINLDHWNNCTQLWNNLLRFLTGDIWNINFRDNQKRYFKEENRVLIDIDKYNFDCISLFSGGLDSYCGAIKLMEEKKKVCFVGQLEYNSLGKRQEELFGIIKENYPKVNELLTFTTEPHTPSCGINKVYGKENTSRSRSLLFLCGALVCANFFGNEIPLYIPENGFIGLNVPLTNSRKGSCSTRTTHISFLTMFRVILNNVGINNNIENFYAYKSKKEVVNSVENTVAFKKGVEKTISCSHPCLPRWNRNGSKVYPFNCGYCYPCLIRKSSLRHLHLKNDNYSEKDSITLDFLNKHRNFEGKASDLKAVLIAIFKYMNTTENELKRNITFTGELNLTEINKFVDVYRNTMNDLIDLISENNELKEYMKFDDYNKK